MAIISSCYYNYILIEYCAIITATPSIRVNIIPPISAFLNAAYGPLPNARMDSLLSHETTGLQLFKPYRYFRHFGPVTIAQALMLLPAKYSFDAFLYHLWANGITEVGQAWIEFWMIFW